MFRSGERVVHQGRPEWGVGVVLSAQTISDGLQRLRVRFERAGLKTLSSPPAAIKPLGSVAAGQPEAPSDRFAGLDDQAAAAVMTTLPEATRDPFSSCESRLAATLALYRFEPRGGSLIDWAAAQSGLADPLSRFNRQRLEAFFQRFALLRDNHLKKLTREARRLPLSSISIVARSAPPAGRAALSRLITR